MKQPSIGHIEGLQKKSPLLFSDPQRWTHRDLQEALVPGLHLIRVRVVGVHWPTHVCQHAHTGRFLYPGPSAFSVPHLPSGGWYHRGETYKQARVCSQTLQTAAWALRVLPGQEPPCHCAFNADANPLLGPADQIPDEQAWVMAKTWDPTPGWMTLSSPLQLPS